MPVCADSMRKGERGRGKQTWSWGRGAKHRKEGGGSAGA